MKEDSLWIAFMPILIGGAIFIYALWPPADQTVFDPIVVPDKTVVEAPHNGEVDTQIEILAYQSFLGVPDSVLKIMIRERPYVAWVSNDEHICYTARGLAAIELYNRRLVGERANE